MVVAQGADCVESAISPQSARTAANRPFRRAASRDPVRHPTRPRPLEFTRRQSCPEERHPGLATPRILGFARG
jgi:hypothetical protein